MGSYARARARAGLALTAAVSVRLAQLFATKSATKESLDGFDGVAAWVDTHPMPGPPGAPNETKIVHVAPTAATGLDKPMVLRTSFIHEVRRMGQMGRIGRYSIHFHMIGAVRNSYVRCNTIRHTYARAIAIHGVHYLRVQNNGEATWS